MTIHPLDAALDAIAAYFGGLSGVDSSIRGFPEHPEDLDISGGKVAISIAHIGKAEADLISPTEIDRVDQGATADVTYRLAYLTFTVQLDLWTGHRFKRDEVSAIIEAAFHNVLPRKSGLELTSTGYNSRPLTINVEGPTTHDGSDSAAEGEWRRTWDLSVLTDLVATASSPKQAVTVLRVQTDLAGILIDEPDIEFTP